MLESFLSRLRAFTGTRSRQSAHESTSKPKTLADMTIGQNAYTWPSQVLVVPDADGRQLLYLKANSRVRSEAKRTMRMRVIRASKGIICDFGEVKGGYNWTQLNALPSEGTQCFLVTEVIHSLVPCSDYKGQCVLLGSRSWQASDPIVSPPQIRRHGENARRNEDDGQDVEAVDGGWGVLKTLFLISLFEQNSASSTATEQTNQGGDQPGGNDTPQCVVTDTTAYTTNDAPYTSNETPYTPVDTQAACPVAAPDVYSGQQ